MCVPLTNAEGKAFGVIQLDTQGPQQEVHAG